MNKRTYRRARRAGLALIVAVLIILTAFPAAGAQDNALPEWAVDTGEPDEAAAVLSANLPSRFSLVDEGVVTPVKKQDPYGACWSFGAIAAAETSILSGMGQTYEEFPIDLSESHLIWFANHPITELEDPDQAGEGLYVIKENEGSINAAFDKGGSMLLVTTLLSSGVGPVEEKYFPYRGRAGITAYEFMRDNHDEWIEYRRQAYLEAYEMTLEELLEYLDITEEAFNARLESDYTSILAEYEDGTYNDNYSEYDDWSIPMADENGFSNRNLTAGYTLRDGNILPYIALRDKANKWAGLNEDGIRAAKSELLNGHGLYLSFRADTSRPNEKGEARYLNQNTWAHYTYDNGRSNHGVCVVGWDDNYPKENFNSGVDEKTGVSKTPPGDGAWIVKNSWGCVDGYGVSESGREIGKSTWGINGSGYFYVSYYDTSIRKHLESMSFSRDLAGFSFYVYQYDYMPAYNGFLTLYSDKPFSSANVFTAQDVSDLVSVGATTGEDNMRVTFSVYRLNDGTNDPTDGTLLAKTSKNFEYAGYHRIDLEKSVPLNEGDRFSVVVTAAAVWDDGTRKYVVAANRGMGEQMARILDYDDYCKAVVNPGESFIYMDGKWQDWGVYLQSEEYESKQEELVTYGMEVDNFSIKAFAVPREAFVYTCTRGKDGVWRMKTDTGIGFTFERSQNNIDTFSHFTKASVDDTALTEADFSFDFDGVLTLKPEFLNTLSEGQHKLKAEFDDGKPVTVPFRVISQPTGGGGGGGGGSSSSSSSVKRDISLADTAHGNISADVETAKSGDTVTVTPVPDEGFYTVNVTVTGADGKTADVTRNSDGTFTFTMPAKKVTVSAEFEAIEDYMLDGDGMVKHVFADVTPDDYFFTPVDWAYTNDVTRGTDDDHFSPDAVCTRAQIVTFLYRASGAPETEGENAFTDVPADAYYADAVRWAVSNGITTGTDETHFSPDETCTRAQAVTFLCRMKDGSAQGESAFTDVPEGAYYAGAVSWASENNITAGTGEGTFSPDAPCTRAQIVTFLYRAMTE
ncbi:MAG: S-layer homology domain-containing protein [Clostridia bacterium]|nr:S-layer homology domain-containing protein [Clostridia bacterium]